MKKDIFVAESRFTLQLPYLHGKSPACVMIDAISAENLVENLKTHQILHVCGNDYVLTPIKSPVQNLVYQIGSKPL